MNLERRLQIYMIEAKININYHAEAEEAFNLIVPMFKKANFIKRTGITDDNPPEFYTYYLLNPKKCKVWYDRYKVSIGFMNKQHAEEFWGATKQVGAAFYSPMGYHSGPIIIFIEGKDNSSFFKTGLDNAAIKSIFIHEFTHYLQDSKSKFGNLLNSRAFNPSKDSAFKTFLLLMRHSPEVIDRFWNKKVRSYSNQKPEYEAYLTGYIAIFEHLFLSKGNINYLKNFTLFFTAFFMGKDLFNWEKLNFDRKIQVLFDTYRIYKYLRKKYKVE